MSKFVTFQQAKIFFEKGYNTTEQGYYVPMYDIDGNRIKEKLGYQKRPGELFDNGFILCPTQSEINDWLFETHHIFISLIYDYVLFDITICYIGYYNPDYIKISGSLCNDENFFTTPQQAYSFAFDYILNKLI